MKSSVGPGEQPMSKALFTQGVTVGLVCLCCTGMLAVPAIQAQATSAELGGVVVNQAGEPLRDVAVSIAAPGSTTRTDELGRFTFPSAPWGQVRLRLRAVGFVPLDTLMLLQSGTSYSVRVQLRQFVPQLDTVRVQGTLAFGKPVRYRHTGRFDDFYERRARKPGTYFTREDIERSPATKVSELISSTTGITLAYRLSQRGTEPHIRIARCTGTGGTRRVPANQLLAVFINGQRIGDGIDALGELLTSEIETLEVYRGPTQLPLEAMGDACAAVFITTRYTPGSVLTGNR